jgi:hypothetical protein
MTKRVWKSVAPLFLLGCLLGVSPPAPAEEKKEPSAEGRTATAAAESVREIGMALQLAEYGRKENSPEMLISAARILRKIRSTPGTDEPKAEGGDAAKKPAASLGDLSDKLLEEARKKAGDDKTILEMADRVAREEKARGALGGPRSYTHAPGDGVNLTWSVRFRVGVPASVSVVGDDVNRLTTTVQGPGGYVYSWTGHNASTSWVPGVPGFTTITVVNRGPGAAYYTMYHN